MSNWQFINSTLFILFVAFKIIFFLKILFVDVWIVWISVFFVFKHSELCCRFEQLGRNSVLCHLAALTPSSLPRPPTQRNTRWDRTHATERQCCDHFQSSWTQILTALFSSQASEHIPPGYEAVSLLEALNGPLNTTSVAPPPLHSGPSHVSGALPPYSSEPHPAPARSLSPLDHSNSGQALKLKKSGSKWACLWGQRENWSKLMFVFSAWISGKGGAGYLGQHALIIGAYKKKLMVAPLFLMRNYFFQFKSANCSLICWTLK